MTNRRKPNMEEIMSFLFVGVAFAFGCAAILAAFDGQYQQSQAAALISIAFTLGAK